MTGERKQKGRFRAETLVFIVLMASSFSLLLVSSNTVISGIKEAGFSIFSGLRGGIHEGISLVSRTVLSVRELRDLRREYTELSNRLTRYEQRERRDAELLLENIRLREQLGFSQSLSYRRINAEIIGRDPDNLYASMLVINKGKYAGVAANMPVIAWQNGNQALVGKVIQAGQFESIVMPLYDLNSSISSRLVESRYEGLVEGQGSPALPLMMRFVGKQARDEVGYGDMVVSSGLGKVYPPGLAIGRVSRVLYRDNEISIELELEGPLDFSRLEYVIVIDTAGSEEPVAGGGNG